MIAVKFLDLTSGAYIDLDKLVFAKIEKSDIYMALEGGVKYHFNYNVLDGYSVFVSEDNRINNDPFEFYLPENEYIRIRRVIGRHIKADWELI